MFVMTSQLIVLKVDRQNTHVYLAEGLKYTLYLKQH